MLAHELAHHKRADLWINALQNVLGILWWFNPLVRLLNRVIRRIREDCCDDLLLCRNITTDSRYCHTLLQVAANLNRSTIMIAALGFAETIHPLGRRIKRIMDPHTYRWPRLSVGALASMVILAALLLPGLSSEHSAVSEETPLEVLALNDFQPATDLSVQSIDWESSPDSPHSQGQSEDLAANSRAQTQNQALDLAESLPQQLVGIGRRASPTRGIVKCCV